MNNRLFATHYYSFSETTDVESIDSSPFYIRQYNYVVDVDGGGVCKLALGWVWIPQTTNRNTCCSRVRRSPGESDRDDPDDAEVRPYPIE